MDTCKLTLVPDYGSSIQMVLSSVPFVPSAMDEMILNREYIYSDQPYHAELHDISEKIEDFSFFVNDMEIESAQEENNVISFGTNRRIFTHNYGFVQITLNIKLENQSTMVLYSKFIPILVVNVRNNRSVERMVEYIYTHREQFLLCGSQPSMQNHGLKAEGKKDLESQIQIIRDIIQVYNETIGYFRLNARFRLSPIGRVDHYEKVKSISSRTINCIMMHPEQLMRTSVSTGIRIHRQNFIPNKTLVEENAVDYDIYENQIVVGFLRSLYVMVGSLTDEITKRIKQFPDKQEIEKGYFLSAAFAYSTTKRRLEKNKTQLNLLRENIEELYIQYREILSVSEQEVFAPPQPSAVLISVRAYRLIYEQIIRWFQFGMYDFSGEDFILPMLRSDKIYEYYILLKLYNYIMSKGFSLQEAISYSYKNPGFHLSHTNPFGLKTLNTFQFKNVNASIELTLYYEPIIYNGKSNNVGENKVELFRNMSYSFRDGEYKGFNTGSYYCPDYVIKVQRAGHCQYIILDAKFSKRNTTKENYLCKLLYRYIISISAIDQEDSLLGLVIVNGKSDGTEDVVEDIYNRVPDHREILPFAKILTLTETQDENLQLHENLIDQLLQGFII